MTKHNNKQLRLKKQTLFAFSGNGDVRNSDSTERTTITITLTSIPTILLGKK